MNHIPQKCTISNCTKFVVRLQCTQDDAYTCYYHNVCKTCRLPTAYNVKCCIVCTPSSSVCPLCGGSCYNELVCKTCTNKYGKK